MHAEPDDEISQSPELHEPSPGNVLQQVEQTPPADEHEAGETPHPVNHSRGGRPVTFDAEKQKSLCGLLTAGWSRRRAALYLGIAPSTVRALALRDPVFRDRLLKCELGSELTPLQQMRDFATRSWRAAAWLLERQHPHVYGRRGPELLTRQELAESMRLAVEFAAQMVEQESDRNRLLTALDVFLGGLGLNPTRVPEKADDQFWHEDTGDSDEPVQ